MANDPITMVTAIGTFTNGAVSALATIGANLGAQVRAGFGGCNGLNFHWALKNGSTAVQQGYGLAGADAGFDSENECLIATGTAGGTIGFTVTPVAGTSTCVANLQLRIVTGR